MVVQLNLKGTFAGQNGLCFNCGAKMHENDVYFVMDQKAKPPRYEVYCRPCGLIEEKRHEAKEGEQ